MEKPKLSTKERKALARERLIKTGRICGETYGKPKPGQESLTVINDRVCSAEKVEDCFSDMKTLMTAVAYSKGYIKRGKSKIRKGGSPDDFLNFVTMKMCERWIKQKTSDLLNGEYGKTKVENWLAYANIVIFNYLNEYNMSVMDYNLHQIPLQRDHEGKETEIEIEDPNNFEAHQLFYLSNQISPQQVFSAIQSLPLDLSGYALDIIYYLTHNTFLDSSKKDFAIIGSKFLRRALENA